MNSEAKDLNCLMTDSDKRLVFIDLCGRLPYGVKCKGVTTAGGVNTIGGYSDAVGKYDFFIEEVDGWFSISNIVPYLRPMSSMTENEYEYADRNFTYTEYNDWEYVDWLNAHHLDYRGLIEKGLAIEAAEGIYDFA